MKPPSAGRFLPIDAMRGIASLVERPATGWSERLKTARLRPRLPLHVLRTP